MVRLLPLLAVLLAGTTTLVWRSLPPLHQDELMPLLPLVWLHKTPAAWGNYFRANCRSVFGHVVPIKSYAYEGPLKALFYVPFFPISYSAYRLSNLVWVWTLYALMLWASRRFGRPPAAALCLTLLAVDVSFTCLGLTEGVRFFHLIAGMLFFLLVCEHLERPRWWKTIATTLLVFLAEWNKIDFLWFVMAGAVAAHAAALLYPLRRALRALVSLDLAIAAGLGLTYLVVPGYLDYVVGSNRRRPPFDLTRTWNHFMDLWTYVDPFSAYHHNLDIGAHRDDRVYVVYRAVLLWLYPLVSLALVLAGVIRRRGPYVVLGLLPLGLTAVAVGTPDSWAVHHIIVMKPFLYVGLAVLAASLLRRPRLRRATAAVWVLLVAGSGYANVRSVVDMAHADAGTGIYSVSWNAVDAWQAAARSDEKMVFAMDWGVFFAGIVSSPPDQRWEMGSAVNLAELRPLMGPAGTTGFLFKRAGPHAWLLTQSTYPIVRHEDFAAHSGDPWVFLVLGQPSAAPHAS